MDHSTDDRYRGQSPDRSGRRGSETQATRCREGETRSSSWWEETCERLELTKYVNGNLPDCVPARLDSVLEGSRRWASETSGEALSRTWFLLRNRMSELFTYGSVGGAGYNLGASTPGEGPLLPGDHQCPQVGGSHLGQAPGHERASYLDHARRGSSAMSPRPCRRPTDRPSAAAEGV